MITLTPTKVGYVRDIIHACQAKNLPKRAAIICVETALVETNLTNYANDNVPSSLAIDHDAVGYDHASLGILQQQTGRNFVKPGVDLTNIPAGIGWDIPRNLMNPVVAAGLFFNALVKFNWEAMSNGDAAQTVQNSAFPDRYQKRDADATIIVNKYWTVDMTPEQTEAMIIDFGRAYETGEDYPPFTHKKYPNLVPGEGKGVRSLRTPKPKART